MPSVASARATIRAAILGVWVAVLFALRMTSVPLRPWHRRWDRAWRSFLHRFWGRVALRIMGIRLTVRGALPEPPFLLVSNHFTMADIVVFATLTGPAFVAKDEISRWPLVGFVARWMDTLFIQREHWRDTVRVNGLITEALARGEGIHLFAESRVAVEGTVIPFKSALLQPAAVNELPVHYAAISYRTPPGWPPASEVVVWREGVTFVEHALNLMRLPYLECTVVLGDGPLRSSDRKELARALYEAVNARFIPMA